MKEQYDIFFEKLINNNIPNSLILLIEIAVNVNFNKIHKNYLSTLFY